MMPREYTAGEAAKDFAINAVGEGGGRALMAPFQAAKWTARAGGSAPKARVNLTQLVSAGIPDPPAHLVLRGTGAGFSMESMAKFLAEHPGSAEAWEAGARRVSDGLMKHYNSLPAVCGRVAAL